MAITFKPLSPAAFPEAARPSIADLNAFLRDLSGLEGTIQQPRQTNRSDSTISRRTDTQVHVSRITPSITQVVSGVSTVVGTPALSFGLVDTVGSTTTALSINSAIALFSTSLPAGLTGTASPGNDSRAARANHVHPLTDTLKSTANGATLILSDNATDSTLTTSLGALRLDTPSIILESPAAAAANRVNVNLDVDYNNFGIQSAWATGTPTAGSEYACWDARFNLLSIATNGNTFCGYESSALSFAPTAGSTGTSTLYGIRIGPLISTANALWGEIATAYFRGVRRLVSSVSSTLQAAVLVEPPTAGTTDQVGLYIRNQTAQAVATNRKAIMVEAMNSGTNRYCFYGASDTAYFGGRIQHAGSLFGIFGATPSTQYGTTGTVAGFAAGTSTAVTVDSTFTGNTGTTAYTMSDVVFAMKRLGGLAY